MKRKCDKCDKSATHHSIEIVSGEKIEKHLCDFHAAQEGLTTKAVHTPLNELLTNFVKLHAGSSTGAKQDLICESCGLSFTEFREESLLGCSECYAAFEEPLEPLLERAHEGGNHHVGKVPRRAGASELRQQQLLRMRKRLDEAVNSEDYELTARLRDELKRVENAPEPN